MASNTQTQVDEAFNLLETGLNGLMNSRFHKERKEALRLFSETGFPHPKHEEYKYLNLRKLLKEDFILASPSEVGKVNIDDYAIPDMDAYRLVFIDGFFSAEHSSSLFEENGVLVTTLAHAQESHIDLLNEKFDAYKDINTNPFAVINTAMARDGAFIHLENSKELEKPVHIMHINSGNQADKWVQPTNTILLGQNSEADIIQSFYSTGDAPSKDNVATYVNVGKDARMNLYTHQDLGKEATHFNAIYGNALENSTPATYNFVLNGGFVRNNIHIALDEQYSNCHMYGLYVPTGREVIDNHTLVDHRLPDCESNELYKGVLLDRAKATFNGKIFVQRDAQNTNAFQSNKNLVVSDNAQINTKPQLEIWADDVKCTHGATVGQLNKEALYYMRSRGIPEKQAKALLTYAFAGEVIQQFKLEGYKRFCREKLAEELNFEGLDNFI